MQNSSLLWFWTIVGLQASVCCKLYAVHGFQLQGLELINVWSVEPESSSNLMSPEIGLRP